MATTVTTTFPSIAGQEVAIATWAALGGAETGDAVCLAQYSDRSVQIDGTFGGALGTLPITGTAKTTRSASLAASLSHARRRWRLRHLAAGAVIVVAAEKPASAIRVVRLIAGPVRPFAHRVHDAARNGSERGGQLRLVARLVKASHAAVPGGAGVAGVAGRREPDARARYPDGGVRPAGGSR